MKFGTLCFVALTMCALRLAAQVIDEPLPGSKSRTANSFHPSNIDVGRYLQFKTGTLEAVTSPEFGTRIGINQVTKLFFTPRLELLVMTEPYVHSSDSGR